MKLLSWLGIAILLCLFGVSLPSNAEAQSREVTVTQQIGTDTTPPTTPSILSVVPVSSAQIDIAWSASTDDGFGLAGYRLYRDAVQIATLTQLTYNDTGLAASTTYSYTVEAFDVAGNVSTTSAAVSTTTFALPVIPPVVEATSTSGTQAGGGVWPRLSLLDITTGVTSAEVRLGTLTPIQFELRYGQTESYNEATVRSEVLRREHTTFVTNLEPQTRYYYELIGIDRFGRERVLSRDSFVTKAAYTIDAPPNVLWFTARAVGSSVSLQWDNPLTDTFSYVQVIRSSYEFPASPTEGFLVYQGTAESFFDNDALVTETEQFYTIFVYNLDGLYSSGAIAFAVRQMGEATSADRSEDGATEVGSGEADRTRGAAQVLEGGGTVPADSVETAAAFELFFSDSSAIQKGDVRPATDEMLPITAAEPFKIRVPATRLSAAVYQLVVTIHNPFLSHQYTAHLLRLNDEKTYYEAVIAPLALPGDYPVRVDVYDHTFTRLVSVSGTLLVEDVVPSTVVERPIPLFMSYLFSGMGLLLLLLLCLLLLLRRRSQA
jgi:hypothetical protein